MPGRRIGRHMAVAVILAALTAVAPALPAAAARAGGNGTFGISPAPASDGRAAPYFSMTAAAGHSASGTAIISNEGQTTEKLKVSQSTGVTAANGGSAFSRSFQRCAGPGCWVTGLPASVTLPGSTGAKVPFTVRVPAGTAPGQYLAGITVQSAAKPRRVQVGSNGNARAQAVIIQQVTVGVAVTVGHGLKTRFRIPGVSGAAIGTTARLSIRLDNTGQTFAHAAGLASCTASGRRHSYPVFAATILPRDRAAIAVNARGLPFGATMPCQVRLRYGQGLSVSWAGQVTIPAPPRTRIIHTGKGVYAVVPLAGIPPWAIALLVMGVLVLAVLAVLLFRMRKRRQIA
jgi:hypothetical protein